MYLSAIFNPLPMKASLSLLLFCCAIPLLFAQRGNSLKQAETLLEQKKYTAVVEQLTPLLKNTTQLSGKERVVAYFLRGQAYFKITRDIYLRGLYPDAFFLAYADLKRVTQLDDQGKYQATAFADIQNMRSAMLNNALRKTNEANIPDLSREQATDLANTAQQFLDILIELEPRNYLFFDLRGQAQLARRDSMPAAMDFQTAIRLYKDYPPPQPDLLIAYAYYRIALVQRITLDYDQQALSTIHAGMRFLEQEWGEADKNDPEQTKNYQQAIRDLDLLELDILYSKETYRAEALEKLATAVKKYPREYQLLCAYAGLLEKQTPEQAIAQYQKAIVVDPAKKMAYYNLAALYINQSVSIIKENKTQDIQQKADQLALQAVPLLEKAHQIDPKDTRVIRQLMTIFLRTKQTDQYQRYRAKLEGLSNY